MIGGALAALAEVILGFPVGPLAIGGAALGLLLGVLLALTFPQRRPGRRLDLDRRPNRVIRRER